LSEQSVLPSKNEIDYLVEKSLQSAQFYQERLLTYLLSYPNLYPEYYLSNGKIDNVYPNQGWSYTAGIHV
jgi:hypothetical protein